MREFSRHTAMHLSKSRKEAREKLEAEVKNFEENYSPEKIYDHITDGIIL